MSEVEESARMNAQGYQESSGAKKNDEVHGAAPGSARSIEAPMDF